MNSQKPYSRHNRSGVAAVEWAVILSALGLAIFIGVSKIGNSGDTLLQETATGVGDPSQLVNHPILGGQNQKQNQNQNKNQNGNNGVGNGEDAQPPGNPPVNDGPGTSPGNPGNSNNNPGGNSGKSGKSGGWGGGGWW